MIPTSAYSSQQSPVGRTKTAAIQVPDRNVDSTLLRPAQSPSSYRDAPAQFSARSPVNEHGSFFFDRVLKTGKVHRRVKHRHSIKASWKLGYLVLRPNLLSVYKDEENTSLRLSLTLSEVTAVAPVRSPRSRRLHVFGVFTPSKNYRFQAFSEKDAEDWIERIRSETRIDEEDEALLAFTRQTVKHQQHIDDISELSDLEDVRTASSPELGRGMSPKGPSTRFFGAPGYSTNDVTSFSEWSDGPTPNVRLDSLSSTNELSTSVPVERPTSQRPASRDDDFGVLRDPERVLCHGFLQGLRIEGGVRQWKRRWAVLRPKSLAFYKDEQEYSAIKIIPMSQVIDAAEIDPLSRSKELCFQIIAEEKTFRLCAPDEESFAQWLGCLKSIIVATRHKSKIAPQAPPASTLA